MAIQNFMAEQIERMGDSLAYFVETTDHSRLTWRPEVPGGAPTRTVLELVQECIAVNHYFAALLRGESVVVPSGGVTGTPLAGVEQARQRIVESCSEIAEVIRILDDAGLAKLYDHWRGLVSGEKLIIGTYRNMAYHAGQINLIQILGGDSEFHVPPSWY